MTNIALIVVRWLRSPIGKFIAGVVIFMVWLSWHDKKLKDEVRAEIIAEQSALAIKRVETLEKNNAAFRNGTDRDRCLIFMHDSGLPESHCSQP